MGEHITEDGKFQSDKYPTCPAGKVPLSTKDPMAQDLLYEYAHRHFDIDSGFSFDLIHALVMDGFEREIGQCHKCKYLMDVRTHTTELTNEQYMDGHCSIHKEDMGGGDSCIAWKAIR